MSLVVIDFSPEPPLIQLLRGGEGRRLRRGTSLEIESREQVDNWYARTRFDIASGNPLLAHRPQ